MKHTNLTCTKCHEEKPIEEFYANNKRNHGCDNFCIPCRTEDNRTITNPSRMFVNGKYIPKSHQLYKAGNFKTFSDAAFESLAGYATTPEGEVYIIVNPAWKGWIKIGMAVEAEDRLRGYQTSSPLRDFKLKFKNYFDNRRKAEQQAHTLCAKKADKRKGEWFKLDIKIAKDIINNMEVV